MTTFTTQDRQDAQRTPLTAKQRYDEAMEGCDEPDAIERLRFFCSLAMTGQDWIDVEPYFDALRKLSDASRLASKPMKKRPLTDEQIRHFQAMCHLKNVGYDNFIMRFARAIERAHGIGE